MEGLVRRASIRVQPLVEPVLPALRAGVRWGRPMLVRKAALALLYPFLATHRERRFETVTSYGFRLAGSSHDLIAGSCYLFGVWEPAISAWIASRLNPSDGFVDVGANIGYYTLLAARQGARVVAIEASPEIFPELERNIELNAAHGVRAIHRAVGETPGLATVFRGPPGNPGASHTIDASLSPRLQQDWPTRDPAGVVPRAPLFDLLSAEERRSARIVKVDIQGAELSLAPRLGQWLDESRSDIEFIIELSAGLHRELGHDTSRLLDTFMQRGFGMYRFRNEYSLTELLENRAEAPRRIEPEQVLATSGELDLLFTRTPPA